MVGEEELRGERKSTLEKWLVTVAVRCGYFTMLESRLNYLKYLWSSIHGS